MKELSMEEKAKRYDLAIEKAEKIHNEHKAQPFDVMLKVFPELTESNDEKIKKALIDFFNSGAENGEQTNGVCDKDILAWLEKQDKILRQRADVIIANMLDDKIDGIQRELIEFAANAIEAPWLEIIKSADYYAQRVRNIIDGQDEQKPNEPNWCHHKVDLSNCSDEYRKAYFDGWNNCNMQHSQCLSESNDVVKCLINGMKFYYEDNEEATWGTEKFSMKVKDILSWLEKQSQTFTKKDVDDAYLKGLCDAKQELEKQVENISSQTNERAWLYLVADVLTWKDGIGQYLDDPRVQKLAKKLCSEYAQKLYNSPIPSNSSNIGNNKQEPVDKVEQRFKIGDKVRNNSISPICIIENIDDTTYYCDYTNFDIKDQDNWELIKPNSAWSREDEQNLNAALGYIDDEYLRRWLKDVIHTKYDKSAWMNGDAHTLQGIIDEIEANKNISPEHDIKTYDRYLTFLKSIQDRINEE